MLTKAGVKLLDFGLAKLRAPLRCRLGLGANRAHPCSRAAFLCAHWPIWRPKVRLKGARPDGRAGYLGVRLRARVDGRTAGVRWREQGDCTMLNREPVPLSKIQPGALGLLDRLIRSVLAKDRDTLAIGNGRETRAGVDHQGATMVRDVDGRTHGHVNLGGSVARCSQSGGRRRRCFGLCVPCLRKLTRRWWCRRLLDVRPPRSRWRSSQSPIYRSIGGDVTALCWTPIVFAGVPARERGAYTSGP